MVLSKKRQVFDYFANSVGQSRVTVIGDIMLDKYYMGEVKRISPEAPVPVTRVIEQKNVLGGAGNVAHNLSRLGCQVQLIGVVGQDERKTTLCHLMQSVGMSEDYLIVSSRRPTTTKLRVIGGHQQMMRLDFEDTDLLSNKLENAVLHKVELSLEQGAQCLILSDYAKGLCTPRLCRKVIRLAHEAGIPVVVDPKGDKWKKYQGADYITPNLKEVGEALKKTVPNDDNPVVVAAETIRKRFSIGNVIATRSEHGMSFVGENQIFHIPTLAQEVFDVSGAGDTVIAVFSCALAGKLNVFDSSYVANVAAGIVVGRVGTYAVSQQELLVALHKIVADKEGKL
ncbi:D-beta-D-heptose 7-phosphate kinase/D-beta-D-heptose 1-phosphate adenosyltransferase [Sporomusaceae bacterium BoRhaA]|uniref:D-glycero-beta-D-manno-heptose-7-phosphate kinase n=1 Tax=Pelorhabdus rhamnosifermentans TaxID=2772457 RepID=UPI001C05F7CB|nr:D-glycero-beta-D-manno-heptose-7-phosphate kinase [Pelorhabdus rhamnosifermentans]MBU2699019.1 D-beta-D-heptose 7-phosphate kinase/D-beta-D-heptose 1-phosphate adenosyltransferase [Pelorhabdus rhamnosifermentans]